MRRYTFAVIAFVLALAPWHQAVQAEGPRYTIENLGTLNGLVPTITGINAAGQVSGYVESNVGPRAVRYSGGSWSLLPGLDTMNSFAMGINAAGDLVGYRDTPAGQRAFRYRDGVVEEIQPFPGGSMTRGLAINNLGVVVGFGNVPGGAAAFSAAPGAPATALPGLGGNVTIACGINDNGQVAGTASTPAGVQHAIRIDPGSAPIDIESFNGPGGSSNACGIDAAGRVGGQAASPAGFHAFRFGPLVDLDSFGSSASKTESIAEGVSVGFFTLGGATSAFVHTDEDGTVDLNTLVDNGAGWVLTSARAINANGTIAGHGLFNGMRAAFRLAKVESEPADTTAPVITDISATPSTIEVPNGAMVPVAVTVAVTDNVDPSPVCALSGVASSTSAGEFTLAGGLGATVKAVGGESYTLNVTCTDAAGNAGTGSTLVYVLPDTTAPVISAVSATPSVIWPPNGKMVPVTVSVSATDNVDANPACSLKSISGAPAEDSAITGQFTAKVRAEKHNVYELLVKCTDAAGNRSFASTTVTISNKDPQVLQAHKKK